MQRHDKAIENLAWELEQAVASVNQASNNVDHWTEQRESRRNRVEEFKQRIEEERNAKAEFLKSSGMKVASKPRAVQDMPKLISQEGQAIIDKMQDDGSEEAKQAIAGYNYWQGYVLSKAPAILAAEQEEPEEFFTEDEEDDESNQETNRQRIGMNDIKQVCSSLPVQTDANISTETGQTIFSDAHKAIVEKMFSDQFKKMSEAVSEGAGGMSKTKNETKDKRDKVMTKNFASSLGAKGSKLMKDRVKPPARVAPTRKEIGLEVEPVAASTGPVVLGIN